VSGLPKSRRFALVVEYDGSRYAGSQAQRNAPTVQDELEAALRNLTGEQLRVALAGRTDAGVHAEGQVAAFTTASALAPEVLIRALNATLPEEIAVRCAREVPAEFDPRRHATSRTYRYKIYNAPLRSPLLRHRAWHVPHPLDTEAIQAAAAVLVGEHDFAAFGRADGRQTVRCLRRADVTAGSQLVTIELEANAFLRQQVRRTVGALVEVGRERLSQAAFQELLRDAVPASAGPLAPAHGLCLVQVCYPGLDLAKAATLS
jgi:tRNA pseudouridine38-40 synthase